MQLTSGLVLRALCAYKRKYILFRTVFELSLSGVQIVAIDKVVLMLNAPVLAMSHILVKLNFKTTLFCRQYVDVIGSKATEFGRLR